MVYTLNFSKQAYKQLAYINEPYYSNVKKAITNLTKNPRPQGYKKLKGRDGYRIRTGDYRIIYTIFDKILTVEVVAIGHRKDIYE